MPLISAIIPVYNGEKTIRETVESVLSQTFSDLELIVIDDGSQDATLEIVSHIQDNRLKVFSYPNAGVSASRNRGISHAVGEYISFLDADDLWTPDKLEAQFRALQENPGAAVAYSWTDYIDESGQFLYPGARSTATGDVYAKLLLGNFLENGSNPLIRRDALVEVGGFDESLFGPEDWDLFLRLAERYHFVGVPRSQILYRMSTISVSSNFSRQETECLKVIERAFNRTPESLQHLKKLSVANLYQYLTFKALSAPLDRKRSLVAARCLWYALINDPSLLQRRSRLLLIVFIKIATAILLPSQLVRALLTTVKSLSKTP